MIEPGSERWNYLVAEGTRVSSLRNWFLGDAALEIAPMGEEGVNTGALGNLEQYAEEIDVAYGSLRNYRNVASAWPAATRVAAGWKVHQILASRPDLIRPGMSVTEAHKAAHHNNTGRTGLNSPAADQARAVRDMLRNPEVRKEYEAQVVANGGKFSTVDEINDRQTSMVDAIADEADRFSAHLRRVEAALTAMATDGPWGEDTYQADSIRQLSLRLLDMITTSPSRVIA